MTNVEELNVVLTGSAGYLGRNVKKGLQAIGVKVIEIDRANPDNPVDLTNKDDLSSLTLPSKYLLIHLAFPLPGSLKARDFQSLIQRININIVSSLVPERTLFVSSTAVFPLVNPGPYLPQPWEIYGKLKYESEKFFSSKLPMVTIFRPGTLVEMTRESSMMNFIKQLQGSKFPVIPGNGRITHPFTHTKDLENAILKWVVNHQDNGRAYNLTARNHQTLREISQKHESRKALCHIKIPRFLLLCIGSDNFPIKNISKWHSRALCYDYTNSETNEYRAGFRTYDELFTT
jgi:nucleoside-diphosphate-sugar epimerase